MKRNKEMSSYRDDVWMVEAKEERNLGGELAL
jgi:hypothetical protein